jgi:hypothetical protein
MTSTQTWSFLLKLLDVAVLLGPHRITTLLRTQTEKLFPMLCEVVSQLGIHVLSSNRIVPPILMCKDSCGELDCGSTAGSA